MKKIIFGVLFFISMCIFGYLTGYLYIEKNEVAALVLLVLSIASLIGFMVCLFLFLNRNNETKMEALKTRLKLWTDISYHVTQAGDEVFENLPIGVLIYDESYEIKWANNFAKKVFDSHLVDESLEVISKDLVNDVIMGKEHTILNFNNSSYDVIHNAKNDILYFFDVTQREETIKKYNNRISTIGIIGIDNLEESLKRFVMQEKTNIRGQILGEISDWVQSFDCYLQTLSSDRMMVILDRQSLEKMIADKFSILSKVREISSKNRLKSSLSIGFASYDVPADELGSLAQNAIELAERRGGDQVVINIQGEKIQFFGGNTSSLEKNTLVEARMQTMALKEAVEASSNVIIMCHKLADCDAIGSSLGVLHLVMSSGIPVKLAFERELADVTVKKIYDELMTQSKISEYICDEKEALDLIKPQTLLIICDTQSPKLVMFPKIYEASSRISVIDHHRAGDPGYGNNLLSYYVETSASSAVELVSEMFMFYKEGIEFSALEASIMLAGVVVDTNNFTFRSGTRTFEAASTLKAMGADMVYVRKLLREDISVEQALAEAVMRAEVFEKRFALVCLDEDTIVTDRTTLAKISDKLLEIDGVDTSFTIGKIPDDMIGVSARSLDTVNVQVIMEEMGGGGHFNGAATQIHNTTIEAVKQQIIDILKREYSSDGDEKMKVILLQDVKGKGKKDDIVDVAMGYGNYLLTNKLAVVASDENLDLLAKQKEQEKLDEEHRRDLLNKIKSDIQDKFISIYIKVGADGKSFGHITTKLVCDEFEAQTGIHLDKRKVELPSEINSVGIFTATVKLDKDIIATFEINVLEKE